MIQALGGAENIKRPLKPARLVLRVAVVDKSKVNKKTLKSLGAVADLVGGGIQAVFGGKVDLFGQEINQIFRKR